MVCVSDSQLEVILSLEQICLPDVGDESACPSCS